MKRVMKEKALRDVRRTERKEGRKEKKMEETVGSDLTSTE